jgi:thioredoxin reductase (NADPH)
MPRTQVEEVGGEVRLESVLLSCGDGGERVQLPVAAMFIFIGATAHTDMLDGLIERDPEGFILTGRDIFREGRRPRSWTLDRDPLPMETSVPGIFAAGDVRHQSVKRVASAVGEGAVAVALVHQYLKSV